ncbi:hypothetical protein CYMTET_20016 [Cymbomonas tetramitiformis]|uniref:S1 motif domain-containing protein n=1 Tax=Cymbomonas tetramitiformis TaxID=36881 RepID=A0AAE0G5J2_9CHLO|nr:hypothetical protein CYMTET_20016 [Cymbomonas tetramitiformis]
MTSISLKGNHKTFRKFTHQTQCSTTHTGRVQPTKLTQRVVPAAALNSRIYNAIRSEKCLRGSFCCLHLAAVRTSASTNATSDWVQARELKKSGSPYVGKVEMANRGGLIMRMGALKAFIPASQVDPSRLNKDPYAVQLIDKLSKLVGEPLTAVVTDVDEESRKLVMSEKQHLISRCFEEFSVGSVCKGVVRSVTDFGAFVDLCDADGVSHGIEGLIHVSELSWDRVNHPRECVKKSDILDVKIISLDRERMRIGLSLRQMKADPLLETLDTLMPVEDTAEEDVGSLTPLPGLAELLEALLQEPGIEAVVPGRQAKESRVYSQDLELWLTSIAVEDGYNLLARVGRQVQEVHVVTDLDRDAIKNTVKNVSSKVI